MIELIGFVLREKRFGPITEVGIESVKENGVVIGIRSGREIREGEGCDRPFSHVEKKIVLMFLFCLLPYLNEVVMCCRYSMSKIENN